jgi:thioredoxin-like negative regulator of GroEL
MNTDKIITPHAKPPSIPAGPSPAPATARLFRRTDWLTFLVTFGAVWIGYYLTLAPELTLEDSGELATGSFYAGIPHPPGYPLWTIYTWLWTVMLPFKNVAWRVALGEATSGAAAAGLLGLLVSRGSSLLMEGIEELKAMAGRWENAICLVSGFVAGLLLGFNGFMWSQSVIVEVYSFGVASFMVVLVCLLRWIYAPHQRRYLFLALFVHGICFTNHQTLIVAALGIEVAIAAADFRMGRQLWLWNSTIYVAGLILVKAHILTALEANQAVYAIFHVVGVCSIALYGAFLALTLPRELHARRYLWWTNSLLYLLGAVLAVGPWLAATLLNLIIHHNRLSTALFNVHVLTPVEAVRAVGIGSILVYVVFLAGAILFAGQRRLPGLGAHLLELGRDWLLAGGILLLAASPLWGFGGWFGGLCALAGFCVLAFLTRKLGMEWLVVVVCGFCWLFGAAFYFYMPLAGMTNPPMEWGYPRTVEGFIHAFTRGQYEKTNPSDIMGHPDVFFKQLGMLGTGIIEEFNWVYAFLALVPFLFFRKVHKRERAWLIGITAIYFFLGILLLILLNPPPDRQAQQLVRVFFTASHTIIALMVGYGLTLIAAFMATHYAAFRRWGVWGGAFALMLAFYSLAGASETFITQDGGISAIKHLFAALAGAIGAGALAAVIGSWIFEKRYYEEARTANLLGLVGAAFAFICIEYGLWRLTGQAGNLGGATLLLGAVARSFAPDQYGLPIYAGLLLVGIIAAFVAALVCYRQRAPLALALAAFALMPLHSILTHWSDNEQRQHWFGYWFGHDMFTPPFKTPERKPLYPPMTKDAVLFGGTDPGRFCPTYMIFCDSFIPHKCQPAEDQNFDRRDVYIITQNALADGTYLNYIRAQYNRSAQKDPPFFGELVDYLQTQCLSPEARAAKARHEYFALNTPAKLFGQLDALAKPLDSYFTGLGDRVEKRRRTYTSWFSDKDFLDLPALTARLRPGPQQDAASKYLYENLNAETRQALAGASNPDLLRRNLIRDLNQLLEKRQLYQADRFHQVQLSQYLLDFIKENPLSHTRIRLNRLLLEAAYPRELAKSLGGVYPDREIYIPTPEDSGRSYNEYLDDAQKRLQHDMQFPNEPKHLKGGEDVRYDPASGRVQISGQIAVMSINGLLTKVIFDHNPKNEFFVEESFPLDWMYPHLTPYGIIMKINRHPLPDLTDEVLRKDHEFWTQYSKRLIGDWLKDDTSVKEIAAFVEKVYLRRDFGGFTGDRKFIRDDQAQKSFSKLRSSIAGVYAWRVSPDTRLTPPEYRPKTDAEYQRVLREADFAFRQAFAFCPYSPEAVFRYINLLAAQRRFKEAYLIASTCLKLDPYNGQVAGVAKDIEALAKAQSEVSPLQGTLPQREKAIRENPADFQAAFDLAGAYLQLQQPERALVVLDGVLNHTNVDASALRALLQAYASMANTGRLEATVAKLENRFHSNPTNFNAALGLAEGYERLKKNQLAIQTLDQVLNSPQVDPNTLVQVAQQYATLLDFAKLEASLEKLVRLMPSSPEAWYDLAALKATLGKSADALTALRKALELSAQRLKTEPQARNLLSEVQKDPHFSALRQTPEYKQMTGAK